MSMKPFELLSKGRASPTFLKAAFGNRVLRLLNALIGAKVSPAGAGRFVVTENGVILDLTPMFKTQQNADMLAIQKQIATLQGQVSGLTYSLKNATVTCNPTTSQITLTFPKLPS